MASIVNYLLVTSVPVFLLYLYYSAAARAALMEMCPKQRASSSCLVTFWDQMPTQSQDTRRGFSAISLFYAQ